MRSSRKIFPLATALGVAFSFLSVAPDVVVAQDLTILVAPVIVTEPVDRKFGEKIAEEVRDALEMFPGYTAVDKDEIKDLIKQYGLDEKQMSAIEWRQLASQMNASMVMVGTAMQNGAGVEVDVDFVDPKSGDELPMIALTVADDDEHEQAAQGIMGQLEEAVEYAKSVAFCADYLASENAPDAISTCTTAIEMNPEAQRAYYLRGRAHMLAEAWTNAVEDLQRVVDLDNSNTEALQSIAFVYAQLGEGDKSLDYYRQYLNFQPTDVPVRMRIAYELAGAGGHLEAMTILQDGIDRDPDNVLLLDYMGGIALQAGQADGQVTNADALRTAVEALERVVELKGDEVSSSTLSNITSAYMLNEEYDEALAFSERALSILKNPPPATNGEGENGTGEAEETDVAGATTEQLLGQIHASRARIYGRMELPQEAATEYEQALSYNPDLPNGYQQLATFRLQAGDSEGAITDFRTAVEGGADANQIAQTLFGQAFKNHFEAQQTAMQNPASINVGEVERAIGLFQVAAEFAEAPDVVQQVQFFIAFGYYLKGSAVDRRNEADEACGPSRTALGAFQSVAAPMGRAGEYQPRSQSQIREASEVQLYRQEQIIRKAC